ncbi:GNAT family N-acetyltransferase [Streptomyces sp. NBC_01508]|uniref:GNAT family N-acetyltransferase n=1 Tax=Streptomyces sp. NBC_01508 TaxID=2903888 RepID=UPI00386764F4
MLDITAPAGEGPRTRVRPYRYEDADEFASLARDSGELHRPWLFPPRTPEAYADYASGVIEDPTKAGFLVCDLADGRIAGFININNIVRGGFLSGALGYGAFAHAAGRGLMAEGLGHVLRHAFGPLGQGLGLHRLEANIQPANTASIALVRRAGFRYEGCSPDFLHIDGAWRDHERWAITADMIRDTPPERLSVPSG